jgi:hypothetical protein
VTRSMRLTTLRMKVTCLECKVLLGRAQARLCSRCGDEVPQGRTVCTPCLTNPPPKLPGPPPPLKTCRYCKASVPSQRRSVCDTCKKAQNREKQRAWRQKPDNKLCVRLANIKHRAHKRGLHFSLTLHEAQPYWDQPCHYCGAPLEGLHLDRVDNSQGYEAGNIVSCCPKCNVWKRADTVESFLDHARRIVENQALCSVSRASHKPGSEVPLQGS